MLQATSDEEVAIKAALQFSSTPQTPGVRPFTLFKATLLSLTDIPWAAVIDLRSSPNFNSLRRVLVDLTYQPAGNLGTADNRLGEVQEYAMAEIVGQFRPRLTNVAVKSVLGNNPLR